MHLSEDILLCDFAILFALIRLVFGSCYKTLITAHYYVGNAHEILACVNDLNFLFTILTLWVDSLNQSYTINKIYQPFVLCFDVATSHSLSHSIRVQCLNGQFLVKLLTQLLFQATHLLYQTPKCLNIV